MSCCHVNSAPNIQPRSMAALAIETSQGSNAIHLAYRGHSRRDRRSEKWEFGHRSSSSRVCGIVEMFTTKGNQWDVLPNIRSWVLQPGMQPSTFNLQTIQRIAIWP